MLFLGIDPGKDKCGLALVDSVGRVVLQKIVPSNELIAEIEGISKGKRITVVMGNGTTARRYLPLVEELDLPVELVEEGYSTLEAKELYFRENGYCWQVILPKGLRSVRRPLDDYAARILVDRYLNSRKNM